ncbi:MAG: dTMP kinase [Acutalibacteraceae bacterium]
MGKLIVFEGLDGSGKTTQLEKMKGYLDECGISYRHIKLPNYGSDSSVLVRHYLAGDYGEKPGDVNAFAASSFFAVDRYASFKADWGRDYCDGRLIVADRYTTSNAALQCSKLCESEWDFYLDWLYDFEFEKLKIPRPDKVIFLDMPPEISQKLLSSRYNGDEQRKDIHERDLEYLLRCREASLYAAKKLGWTVIKCWEGENARQIDDIFADILKETKNVLKGE